MADFASVKEQGVWINLDYVVRIESECVCAPPHVQRYLSKISGPLLDRIDLHIEVTPSRSMS